jgi:hypothetical protein
MQQDYTTLTLPDVQPDLDMNGGFLCSWTYWQPDTAAPDPEVPGLKLSMITYLPVAPAADCLCGSGESYALLSNTPLLAARVPQSRPAGLRLARSAIRHVSRGRWRRHARALDG